MFSFVMWDRDATIYLIGDLSVYPFFLHRGETLLNKPSRLNDKKKPIFGHSSLQCGYLSA